jgi:hypothetical protein
MTHAHFGTEQNGGGDQDRRGLTAVKKKGAPEIPLVAGNDRTPSSTSRTGLLS